MAVAPPHDAGVRPMFSQALGHVLDDGPHLRALGGARRTKDGDNRCAARNMIDVHRRKAALIVMRVPERKLLAAMRCAEGVVDVEDLKLARRHGGAELVNESCTQPRRLGLARCILKAGDGRLRGQRSAALWTAPNRKLHQRIMPQPIEVVSILVAARDRRYPRHQHFEHRVSDAIRIAPIRHGVRKPPAHTDACAPPLAAAATPPLEDWLPPLKSTVIFLRQTDGRSKGSGVSSVMAAVALGGCTIAIRLEHRFAT